VEEEERFQQPQSEASPFLGGGAVPAAAKRGVAVPAAAGGVSGKAKLVLGHRPNRASEHAFTNRSLHTVLLSGGSSLFLELWVLMDTTK